MFKQTSRRLKLKNLPECSGLSGGAAVELLAQSGNPMAFQFPRVMTRLPDCNFSFSGIKFRANHLIEKEEERLSELSRRATFQGIFNFVLSFTFPEKLSAIFIHCFMFEPQICMKVLSISSLVMGDIMAGSLNLFFILFIQNYLQLQSFQMLQTYVHHSSMLFCITWPDVFSGHFSFVNLNVYCLHQKPL